MAPDRVILTGFMGSGKSTVGPLVADQLGYRFIDLDERVAEAAGRPVEALFEERGEGIFRALEAAVLSQVLVEEAVVIATGGGALVSDGTLHMAKDGGVVVYLRVPIDVLVERLQSVEGRPLLTDADGQPLVGSRLAMRIEEILAPRRRFYEQADAIIDAEGMTPPDVAAAIVLSAQRLTERSASGGDGS
jgi:shikimate kinase